MLDKKIGFISPKGVVVKPQYDEVEFFGVYKEDWALVSKNGKYGFINDKGNEIVKPVYDEIGFFDAEKPDLAAVVENGETAYINKHGKKVKLKDE